VVAVTVLDLYSEDPHFESLSIYQLPWMSFSWFSSDRPSIFRNATWIRPIQFFLNPSQFIIHQSTSDSTANTVSYWQRREVCYESELVLRRDTCCFRYWRALGGVNPFIAVLFCIAQFRRNCDTVTAVSQEDFRFYFKTNIPPSRSNYFTSSFRTNIYLFWFIN
jgi:hypothetical protein